MVGLLTRPRQSAKILNMTKDTIITTVRIDTALLQLVKAEASERGVRMQGYLDHLVRQGLGLEYHGDVDKALQRIRDYQRAALQNVSAGEVVTE